MSDEAAPTASADPACTELVDMYSLPSHMLAVFGSLPADVKGKFNEKCQIHIKYTGEVKQKIAEDAAKLKSIKQDLAKVAEKEVSLTDRRKMIRDEYRRLEAEYKKKVSSFEQQTEHMSRQTKADDDKLKTLRRKTRMQEDETKKLQGTRIR